MLGKDSEAGQDFEVEPNSVAALNSEAGLNFVAEQDFEAACDYETELNFETGFYSVAVRDPVAGGVCGGGGHPEGAEHEAVCGAWQREAVLQECVAGKGGHSACLIPYEVDHQWDRIHTDIHVLGYLSAPSVTGPEVPARTVPLSCWVSPLSWEVPMDLFRAPSKVPQIRHQNQWPTHSFSYAYFLFSSFCFSCFWIL